MKVADPGAFEILSFVIVASWRNGRLAFVLSLLEVVGRILLSLAPVFVGLLVTGIATGHWPSALLGGIGLVGTQGLVHGLTVVGVHERLNVNDRLGFEFDQRTSRCSGQTPTMDHLVDATYRDQLQILTDRRGAMGSAFMNFVNVLNNVGYLVGTFIVAASIDVRLLLLLVLVLVIPAALATRRTMAFDARRRIAGQHTDGSRPTY